jgi:hypothetical protein
VTPTSRWPAPRAALYAVTVVLALAFSYDLLRKPIQIPDSLIDLLHMQESSSVSATFWAAVEQRAYLRPLRIAQVKALFDLAQGQHYQLMFRGFHALLIVGVLLLFVRALRVRSWIDFSAGIFALMVLTGTFTFRGTVREAFPINHFAEVLLFCLAVLNLAQSRGGRWVDVAAGTSFLAASLTLESGLLVWVVAVVAYGSGLRGISARGVGAMTLLLIGYFAVRFLYLSTGAPGLDERNAGVWITLYEPNELIRRFGENPTWFYAYNVVASMLTVLCADPERGVFWLARAWVDGRVPPHLLLSVVLTTTTTVWMGWAVLRRLRGRATGWLREDDQFVAIFVALLLANAAMSYAYTKHEIVSVAGAFYAYAAFVAARYTVTAVRETSAAPAGVLLVLLVAGLSTLWAFRSVGVHHVIQIQAFKEQLQWARLDPARLDERDNYPSDARAQALAAQLRRDALELRLANPSLLRAWPDSWWGE